MTAFVAAAGLDEACELARANPGAKFVSGGTALVLLLQQRLLAPALLIGLGALGDVPGWREIRTDDGWLHLGGGVTLAEVATSPLARRHAPSLARAAGLVGNQRVRNVATMGGAVAEADYAADIPAVLVNLGAVVEISDGSRARAVPVAGFLLDYFSTVLAPDEVVTGVRVPLAPAGTVTSYLKFSSRSAEDRPCVVVAASAVLSGQRVQALDVVVGAIGPVPQRWPDVLAAAAGGPLDDAAAAAVADGYAAACDPLDDIRGSAWYRREIVRTLVRRAVAAVGRGGRD
ncbi:MAG TPA: FAD binding domain-containing protein [Trebonia sp.]|nr:FAD binding domain-containing protein [Trebonia sp.]